MNKENEDKSLQNEKIYYCMACAMIKPVKPLRPRYGDVPAAGFCRLCGFADVYAGELTLEECNELGIKVPSLEEICGLIDKLQEE